MIAIPHDLDYAELAAWGRERVPNALFWTVSGAHLYGFPSVDSDVDLRGCFLAPLEDLVGLRTPTETVEPKAVLAGREVEAVSHELGKYLRLLAKSNGYVLEQILSPLVVAGEEFLERLRPLARRCVARGCYHHYRGFLATQRKLMDKQPELKAKTLLYAYRVVLTGIHVLRTGEIQPHLPTLNESFRLSFVPELIVRKQSAEFGVLTGADVAAHRAELDRWEHELDTAYAASALPEETPFDDIDRFLKAERLGAGASR